MTKFRIFINGDDGAQLAGTDDYEHAAKLARELSIGRWLGTKVIGPSGKIMTFADGVETGYLSNGKWIAR